MKYFFISILFFFSHICFAQDTILADKAKDYIDIVMLVKGKVVSIKAANDGKTTNYINIDRPYPNSIFTVVLSNNYLEKKQIKLQDLNQKLICVKGKISIYKNDPKQTPQIFNPESISVLE